MDRYRITKLACHLTGVTMAVSMTLSSLLLLIFKVMYNVSFTLIGLLVAVNFFTQLSIDLTFTLFSRYFNIHRTVRLTPFVVFVGLIIYAVLPQIFPDMAFLWIIIGTIIFSVASGLSEVLLSPVIAAIPSEKPDAEMAKLHSMYAWGVVGVVIVSTLFLHFFGGENWMYLALIFSAIPFAAFLLFLKAELPELDNFGAKKGGANRLNKGVLLCALCMFFSGATECTISQWSSSFIESAMGVPKVYGDLLGVALFAALMGLGRYLYPKFGKNIVPALLYGMLGGCVCYFVAGLSINPVIGVAACALTGLFTSMLWPGTLIYMDEKFDNVGVAVYALMAAGGDSGASVGPQLFGIISDKFSVTPLALELAEKLQISSEQVGMRAGLVLTALFPVAGVLCVLYMLKYFKNRASS